MLMERKRKVTETEEILNFDQVAGICVQCLRWNGLLPFQGKSFTYLLTNVLPVYFTLSLTSIVAMHVQCIINHLALGILHIEAIYMAVILIIAIFRYVLIVNWRFSYKKLIDDCREIWLICSGNEHMTLLQYDKKVKIFLYTLLLSGLAIYLAFAGVALLSCISAIKANNTELRKLPYNWFRENVHESPEFKVAFIMQLIGYMVVAFSLSVLDIAAPFVLIYNAGYFNTLQNRLLMISVTDCTNSSHIEIYENILNCVRFHQKILNLSVNTDRLTKILFLLQFVGTGYVLALIGIQLMGDEPDKLKLIPILIFCSSQFLIYQCAPEFLLQESEAVSRAAYYAYTPSMNLKTQKILSILLARAQRPAVMTAGGIVQLSLKTFGSVMSSTISFFVVLKNFAD